MVEEGKDLLSAQSSLNTKPITKRKRGGTTKGVGGRGKKMGGVNQKEEGGMEVCTKFELAAEPQEDESLWTMAHTNWLVVSHGR